MADRCTQHSAGRAAAAGHCLPLPVQDARIGVAVPVPASKEWQRATHSRRAIAWQDAVIAVFARHGESEANLLHEFSNRGLKHGLTPAGHGQTEALAQRLKPLGVVRIYSSPLLRALQTAQILADAWSVPVELATALREFDCGKLEGRSDPASWRLYNEIVADWLARGRWDRRFEGGESFLDLKDRFVPFLERLIERSQGCNDQVVLIGHGGLYHCLLPLVLQNISLDYARLHTIPYAGIVTARCDAGRLVCTEWCGQTAPH